MERIYDTPAWQQKVENCAGITGLGAFDMPLDVLLVEMAQTYRNIQCGLDNMHYPEHVAGLRLDRADMQAQLYRHAELALEIANAQEPYWWYIGYDGLGAWQIVQGNAVPFEHGQGFWISGLSFPYYFGPFGSEREAQEQIEFTYPEIENIFDAR